MKKLIAIICACLVAGCTTPSELEPELREEAPVSEAEQELPLNACYAPPVPAPAACATDDDCDDGSQCTEEACWYGQCYVANLGKGTPCMTPTGAIGACVGSDGACCDSYPSWAYVCKKPHKPFGGCTTAADCWSGSSCAVADCVNGTCTVIGAYPEGTPCRYDEKITGACHGENPAAADHCCL